ncbi:MAG TPA: hypothetical protein DEG92_00190 [Rikenellaceae bacterium]|nr:hypothetical protein [Rikenellaceae bacterium]
MESFCFKQFTVLQGRSAMKVNTDGVLLGAWLSLPSQPTSGDRLEILDIGTGTGVIALIIAQRLQEIAPHFHVLAIDSDAPSANEAGTNFLSTPWAPNIEAKHISLQEMASEKTAEGKFDLIVTNPPYFRNSLKAPCARRSSARHSDSLPYHTLISAAHNILNEAGRFAAVLPSEVADDFIAMAVENNLVPSRICKVRTVSAGKEKRVLMEFFKAAPGTGHEGNLFPREEQLTIQESGSGSYTNEYRRLTGDLYLKF